jgi:hypothetical protein
VGRKDTARVQNEHVEVTVRDKSGIVATRLIPVAVAARLVAGQRATAARVWAVPRLTAARHRVADDVVPALTEALNSAVEASKPVRDEAVARGTVALAALKGEPVAIVKPKRRRRGRKVVAFVGLAGVTAAVVAWWRSQQQPVAPWEDSGTSSRSTVYPASGGTGATGASTADTEARGSTLDSSNTAEPPGPVLATSSSTLSRDGESADDLTTPSTAMGTTSESTSADPGGESTSESPSADDASTMDAPADKPAKTTRSRATKTTKPDGS